MCSLARARAVVFYLYFSIDVAIACLTKFLASLCAEQGQAIPFLALYLSLLTLCNLIHCLLPLSVKLMSVHLVVIAQSSSTWGR